MLWGPQQGFIYGPSPVKWVSTSSHNWDSTYREPLGRVSYMGLDFLSGSRQVLTTHAQHAESLLAEFHIWVLTCQVGLSKCFKAGAQHAESLLAGFHICV
jgi:hypothetical protein